MRRVAMFMVVALLAACASESESGSSDEGDGPPEKSTTTTEEVEERDLEADQELADGAVLTIDDVPPGFEEQPADDDDDDDSNDELDQSLAECLGTTVADLDGGEDEPQASATFATQGNEEVESEVIVYATEDEVSDDLELLKDPASQGCFADFLTESLAGSGDAEVGEVTVEDLGVEDLGEDAVGLGITVPFTVEGGERVLYLDFVLIQQGRTEISMGYQAFDVPFDVGLAYDLADTVVGRVPADA